MSTKADASLVVLTHAKTHCVAGLVPIPDYPNVFIKNHGGRSISVLALPGKWGICRSTRPLFEARGRMVVASRLLRFGESLAQEN